MPKFDIEATEETRDWGEDVGLRALQTAPKPPPPRQDEPTDGPGGPLAEQEPAVTPA